MRNVVFLSLSIDKNVVQINQHSLPYLSGEDVVHWRLEYYWSVRQTKRQDLEFMQSAWGLERRLFTVLGFDSNLVVALH